jgi:predicted Rossmann fold nucleotide-binding protein DprA/Smf involved in DNA uptake
MVLPGRVDSAASLGALDLVKAGGALLVTEPGDVIDLLEAPARHTAGGTHADRYSGAKAEDQPLFDPEEEPRSEAPPETPRRTRPRGASSHQPVLSDRQQAILAALEEPRTLDQLCEATGLEASAIRSELTMLELLRRVTRSGGKLTKSAG